MPTLRPPQNKKISKRGSQGSAPLFDISKNSVDAIRQYFETTLSPKTYLTVSKPNKSRCIVAVGDLHGNPHPALLPYIVSSNPDIIVIGGDTLDLASFSNHPKDWGGRQEEFEIELKRVVAYLEILLTKTSAKIIIMRGNHDDRVYKQLSALIPAHLAQFVQLKDPLQLLVEGLNSSRVSLHLYETTAHHPRLPESELGRTPYLLPLGDAVFSHCNFTGGQPGKAVLALSEWMDEWHQYLGIEEPTVLVQFHVHQWSYQHKRGGFLVLVEPGFAGMPSIEAYKTVYNPRWKPGSLGAVSFIQECVNGAWVSRTETVKPLLP